MHRWTSLIAAVVCVVAGCSRQPPSARVIRVASLGAYGFGELPMIAAHRQLEQAGYAIAAGPVPTGEFAAAVLARGDADISYGSIPAFWTAIGRGAPIRMVMAHAGNLQRLVTSRDIQQCADLEGRRFALHSENSNSAALTRAFLDEACPSVRPEYLMMPLSENRAVALRAGAVSAAVLDLSETDYLIRQAPDRFHVLCDFSARWPDLQIIGTYVNDAWAAAHPDVVRDYLRARVQANRTLAGNPSKLLAEASEVLGNQRDWSPDVSSYIAHRIWDPNGGLTHDTLTRTLAFFQQHMKLTDLSADRTADLSFLEDVLNELGRITPTRRP